MNIEKLIRESEDRNHSMYHIELKETIEYKGLINNKPEITQPTRPIEVVIESEHHVPCERKPQSYMIEQFIDVNDRTKAEIGKTIREMIGDSEIVPRGKYLKSLNKNYPELREADISVKCDKIREILANRNAYNGIVITSIYKHQKSIVDMMTNNSIVVTVDFSSKQVLRYFRKDEYLDFINCGGASIEHLMDFVPYDGSELDIKLSKYEKLSKYMDLEPLYLRNNSTVENPDVFAQFKAGYGFYTYAGNDDESRWIESDEGSRKNLVARSKSRFTIEEANERLACMDAILQFIEEHPEEEDLFDDIDIVINPATGEKERIKKDILDINPDWIGELNTPENELEMMEMAERMLYAFEHNKKILGFPENAHMDIDEALDLIREATGSQLFVVTDYDDYDEE